MSDAEGGAGGADAVVEAVAAALRTGCRPELPLALEGVPHLDDVLDEIVDISRFALALSRGELDLGLRQTGRVAGALKALQGTVRHVTWQAQRVAEGDLSQRIDYTGDFSSAFNSMVEALVDARSALEALATTDPLTATWNRRKFDELLAGEIRRVDRSRAPLSMAVLDIDHFKSVNDTYGHDVGDAVICDMAGIITREIRAVDEVARWGGDEFAILCPGASADGCAGLVERVRGAVIAHSFPVVVGLTVCSGVAAYAHGETPAALFARADQALYRAKAAGRNRVEIAK